MPLPPNTAAYAKPAIVPAGTPISPTTSLPEDQLLFAEQAAQKLKFLTNNEWDERIAQLYAYCEEVGYTKEAAELAVKRAKDLKKQYAQQQTPVP